MRLTLLRKQDNILSLQANANKVDLVVGYDDDPMSVFLYALRTQESRRQYPQRLKVFLDYVEFKGPINLCHIHPLIDVVLLCY